jgi:hypothetical protein
MALKKSQLYTSLWQSCDELCGGMDASQYMVSYADLRKGLKVIGSLLAAIILLLVGLSGASSEKLKKPESNAP